MKMTKITTALGQGILLALLSSPLYALDGNEAELLQLASKGETASALELLGRNTDVNQAQLDGTTALHWAVY